MIILKNLLYKSSSAVFILLLVLSCSQRDDHDGLNSYDKSVIRYFKEVALGFEFGGSTDVTRKWRFNMKLFVGGEPAPDLINELNDIVSEINALSTDGFQIEIVDDPSLSNFYAYFGTASDYVNIYPDQAAAAEENWGLFKVNFNADDELINGHMFVDINRADAIEQKHLLREELTQSLGLARDSPRYSDSIFQSSWTTTTTYSKIDRDVIRLLYHPDVSVGLDNDQVEIVLRNILSSEK